MLMHLCLESGFFTLYALLNSAVFYAEMLLNGLYHAKKRQALWKKWERAAVFAAVFGVAVLLYNSKENTVLYEKFLWYIGTPFLVLVPVVLAIIRCAGQRKKTSEIRSGYLCPVRTDGAFRLCDGRT